MKIYEVHDRMPLLPALLSVWEASVRATHLFLSDAEVRNMFRRRCRALRT